jgi:hypothetical protein
MKYPGTPEDVERLAAFNALIHGEPAVADMTRGLIQRHPNTRPEEWPFIEDESTGQIVSSLCLIPWTWHYEEVTLKAGEMGIVGTLEPYRRRGLIRALDGYFKTLLRDGEYHLSHIQGIPYYYRQFGYEYALPLEGGWQIRGDQMPDDLPTEAQGYHFRAATVDDIPVLMPLYERAADKLDISAARSVEEWRYLLERPSQTGFNCEMVLVLDASDVAVGYVRIDRLGFGKGLIVGETSHLPHPAALAALHYLRSAMLERDKPYIKLLASDISPLVKAARAWGAHSEGRYAWQIHLPDVARLLRQIAPVLERRIAASPFAGLTETVTINLYHEAVELRFVQGKIISVANVGFRQWEENPINIPPLLFAPLVLGYRSREELRQCYPDVGIWGQSQYLVDVLFPKMEAYIYTIC